MKIDLHNRVTQIVIAAIAGFLVFLLLLVTYAFPQTVLSKGNKLQNTISADYADGANYLSNCVAKTVQSVGLAEAQADKFEEIIKAAIANVSGPNPDALFSAIVLAYPDLTSLGDTFQDVLATINGCRDDFRGAQSKVIDDIKVYDDYLSDWFGRTFENGNLPNEHSHIDFLSTPLKGEAALDKMRKPIVELKVLDIYEDGVSDTQNPFESDSPTPTPSPSETPASSPTQ